jgi:hypothetical protein
LGERGKYFFSFFLTFRRIPDSYRNQSHFNRHIFTVSGARCASNMVRLLPTSAGSSSKTRKLSLQDTIKSKPTSSLTTSSGSGKPKKLSLQDTITKRFREKGFTTDQLAKAIFIHEILGIVILAVTWSSCYQWPPSQHPLLKGPSAKMRAAVPSGVSSKFQSNGFLNSRLGSAYIESSCCRKLIRPLTLPGKMLFTFKVVEAWSQGDKPVVVGEKDSVKKNRNGKIALRTAFLAPRMAFNGGSLDADVPYF